MDVTPSSDRSLTCLTANGAKQIHWRLILPGLLVFLATQLSVLVGDVNVELQSNTRAVRHVGLGPVMVIVSIQKQAADPNTSTGASTGLHTDSTGGCRQHDRFRACAGVDAGLASDRTQSVSML